ncbi:hypothetical protein [Streptomyces sp. NPDC007088]|uniref:hypothetical protein n=1 Tax=Streptomyces sp. NPDC007088 TaxID=3364773 RepID=UPI0036801C12
MAGALCVVAGLLCVLVGVRAGGRAVRPFLPGREARTRVDRFPGDARRAADMAIAQARRRATRAEPAVVRVAAVIHLATTQFGQPCVPPPLAAAVLRERYEARGCRRDCVTDAYPAH